MFVLSFLSAPYNSGVHKRDIAHADHAYNPDNPDRIMIGIAQNGRSSAIGSGPEICPV
jgi:hypothetical protein